MRFLLPLLLALSGEILALPTVRVDALLVTRGFFPSRGAAKTAVQQGLVSTRSGSVVKKASMAIDEAAILRVGAANGEESSEDSGIACSEAAQSSPAALETAHRDVGGVAVSGSNPGKTSTDSGETSTDSNRPNYLLTASAEELMSTLEPEKVSRRKTAAARAAIHRNRLADAMGTDEIHSHGLMGRGKKKVAGGPKHYSKKNKRGTAVG